jgi:hypothetical protein
VIAYNLQIVLYASRSHSARQRSMPERSILVDRPSSSCRHTFVPYSLSVGMFWCRRRLWHKTVDKSIIWFECDRLEGNAKVKGLRYQQPTCGGCYDSGLSCEISPPDLGVERGKTEGEERHEVAS